MSRTYRRPATALIVTLLLLALGGPAALARYANLYRDGKGLRPGMIVPLRHLGIFMDKEGRPLAKRVHPINLSIPLFIDEEPTDAGALAGKYPELHLNLRMKPDKSDVDSLFLSNAPEVLSDENRIAGRGARGACGACGLYACATNIAPGHRLRVLLGHLNLADRPLKVRVYFTLQRDGVLSFRQRGWGHEKSPVGAGSVALHRAEMTPPRAHEKLSAGVPFMIMDWPAVKPGLALVVLQEVSADAPMDIHVVADEESSTDGRTAQELATLPVLHSPLYREYPDKLLNWGIIPDSPRYRRLMADFIHARGIFPSPDGCGSTSYDHFAHPEHTAFYTLYESIVGTDTLSAAGGHDATVRNRGSYGARMRLRINVHRTSDSFIDNYGVLAINNATPGRDDNGKVLPADIGGHFTCRVGKARTDAVLTGDGNSRGRLLRDGEALVLWKGPLKNAGTLDVSFFPLPNSSARVLFAIVPLK